MARPESSGQRTWRREVTGSGLGLRRALLGSLASVAPGQIDFLEAAPENWIGAGGRLGKGFRALAERYPVLLHGLSLDIGGQRALDLELVRAIRDFIRAHDCPLYSEHLSYCADAAHLYDLLPIPFTGEAVRHVAARVGIVQDLLGQRIVLENASYYAAPGPEMSELEFIRAVLEEADCDLLVDVNNILVNSINHGYDAHAFLQGLPVERARYFHVAGHYVEADDLRIDTHGSAVIDPVWDLLDAACARFGPLPVVLERDFNIPPLETLLTELARAGAIQQRYVARTLPGCAA